MFIIIVIIHVLFFIQCFSPLLEKLLRKNDYHSAPTGRNFVSENLVAYIY